MPFVVKTSTLSYEQVKAGRTLCVSEAEVKDTNGKAVAIAQVTYARL